MHLGHRLVPGETLHLFADHMLPTIPTLDRVLYEKGLCQPAVDRVEKGLEVGDRILFVNEQPVASAGGLFRIYRTLKANSVLSEVKVVINRGNRLRTLTYHIR